MQAFGSPAVVNPFDRFGDHLRLALQAPASYRLLTWLAGGSGRGAAGTGPAADGRAVDRLWLRPVRPGADRGPARRGRGGDDRRPRSGRRSGARHLVGDASDPAVMARAQPERAVGFVAGTDNDTDEPVTDRRRPADQPRSVHRRAAEPAVQRAAVRRRDSTSCWCQRRWSPVRSTRSSARRCCGGSCRTCRPAATSGPRASSTGSGSIAGSSWARLEDHADPPRRARAGGVRPGRRRAAR